MKNLLILICSIFVSFNAFCQDTIKTINLNEVEITATSNPNKSLLFQPLSVIKLSDTELKRGNGLFMDDAINGNIPGVLMQRRTVSAGQQFNIRGYGNGVRGTNGVNSNFDGQGTKVYLNNIPITDAEGITLMDDIDFGSIGNVEVTKGPSGTLYGLAIAGVVNLKTIQAEKGKTSIGQDLMVGSYGLKRYTTNIKTGSDKLSLLLNYGHQESDGFMSHTASRKDFVNLIADVKISDKQNINAYFGHSDSYDQRGGELTIDQYNKFDYTGNPAYIKNDAHSNIISFRGGVSHTLAFNKNLSNSTTLFGSGITNNVSSAGGWTDKYPLNYGLRSTFDLNVALKEGYKLNGIVGVESQRQNAQIMGYPMVVDSTNPTGINLIGAIRSNQYIISKTTSLFTEWTLSMPNDLSLTAGVGSSSMNIDLQDKFFVAANNKPTNKVPLYFGVAYSGLVSPHVALNKVFSKQLSVYASYSKGYKAPVSSYIFIPAINSVNTSLRPEIGTQYEIGTKGSLLNNTLDYQIAAFNAVFSDKMTVLAVPLSSGAATAYTYIVNGGKQDNKGLELLIKYKAYSSTDGFITAVRPFINFTYSDFKYVDFRIQQLNAAKETVTVDYSGNPVAGVAPKTFNAGVDFTTKVGLYGNANYNYRDAMPFTSDGVNKTKAFSLVNAKLGIRRTIAEHLDIDAYVGANNITGTQYYFMVFSNQLPDAYMPAPYKVNYFGGLNLSYKF
jgi:iron complex outermembrane recepter protein